MSAPPSFEAAAAAASVSAPAAAPPPAEPAAAFEEAAAPAPPPPASAAAAAAAAAAPSAAAAAAPSPAAPLLPPAFAESPSKHSKALPYTCRLELDYGSAAHANVALQTLSVDEELQPHRVTRTLKVRTQLLIAEWAAADAKVLRVTVASFCDMALVTSRMLIEFGDCLPDDTGFHAELTGTLGTRGEEDSYRHGDGEYEEDLRKEVRAAAQHTNLLDSGIVKKWPAEFKRQLVDCEPKQPKKPRKARPPRPRPKPKATWSPASQDCGECRFCLDKPKFGGNGILRRACDRPLPPAPAAVPDDAAAAAAAAGPPPPLPDGAAAAASAAPAAARAAAPAAAAPKPRPKPRPRPKPKARPTPAPRPVYSSSDDDDAALEWFPGTITGVNEPGRTFTVTFDDGGVDDAIRRKHVHSLQTLAKLPKSIRLRVGNRVSAAWVEPPGAAAEAVAMEVDAAGFDAAGSDAAAAAAAPAAVAAALPVSAALPVPEAPAAPVPVPALADMEMEVVAAPPPPHFDEPPLTDDLLEALAPGELPPAF